jgi:hypothetical protein
MRRKMVALHYDASCRTRAKTYRPFGVRRGSYCGALGGWASCVVALCLIVLETGCHHSHPALPAPIAVSAPRNDSVADSSNPYALKCGPTFCDVRSTYCETIKTDVRSLPSNYACKPLPESCRPSIDKAARNCACFPPGTRGDLCSMVYKNGIPGFWRTTVGGH